MKRNRRFFPRKRTLFLLGTGLITAFVGFAYQPVRKALDADPQLALGDKKYQRVIDGKGRLYLNWPEYGALGSTAPESIPDHIVNAFLAREDKRFFSHYVVDPIAFARAFKATIQGSHQGGSTGTMQLVDMVYQYPEQSDIAKIRSKIFEIVMAWRATVSRN